MYWHYGFCRHVHEASSQRLKRRMKVMRAQSLVQVCLICGQNA